MRSEGFTSDVMGDASVDESSMATYACFAFASLTCLRRRDKDEDAFWRCNMLIA